LIVGLRRAGTTVVWESFRRDPRCTCFDEPFHPGLWRGERQNAKGTWRELGEFWSHTGSLPVEGAEPVQPLDELSGDLTDGQIAYLSRLWEQGDAVVMDSVRVWGKLAPILKRLDGILVVHLVRNPAGWITSHLLPSGRATWRRMIANLYRRLAFFRKNGGFNFWHYEDIVESSLRTEHELWNNVHPRRDDIRGRPAFYRLLGFWWGVVNTVDRQLRSRPDVPSVTLTLEEFARRPAKAVERIYEAAGWPYESREYEFVRRPRPGWRRRSSRWEKAARSLRVPSSLFGSGRYRGSDLERLLNRRIPARDPIP
jgi:hypothetical protein